MPSEGGFKLRLADYDVKQFPELIIRSWLLKRHVCLKL